MTRVGVTGSRSGMNETQMREVSQALEALYTPGAEFHHGDCMGVDEQAATLAQSMGYRVVSHPGPDGEHRAHHPSDEVREVDTHFRRNRTIVNTTDLLLVVPWQEEHQTNGGTWYTHDYAVKVGKPRRVFWPSGERA